MAALEPRAEYYAAFFERVHTRGHGACAPEDETAEEWAQWTGEARDLMLQLLEVSPTRRCTAQRALDHAFMRFEAPDELVQAAPPRLHFDASFEEQPDHRFPELLSLLLQQR